MANYHCAIEAIESSYANFDDATRWTVTVFAADQPDPTERVLIGQADTITRWGARWKARRIVRAYERGLRYGTVRWQWMIQTERVAP